MRTRDIHHLVVIDRGRIDGVLFDRDAGGRHGAAVRQARAVGELMTRRAVTLAPETPVRRAANLMRGRSIVVRDGRVVGIVTTADLLDLLGREADRPLAATTRWTLKHRAPHRKRHRAAGAW